MKGECTDRLGISAKKGGKNHKRMGNDVLLNNSK
jgi:hypothetical protein